jgi:hypothetical protein
MYRTIHNPLGGGNANFSSQFEKKFIKDFMQGLQIVLQNPDKVKKYTKLQRLIESINILVEDYSKGEIELVSTILNPTKYEKLAHALYEMKTELIQYPEYELQRKNASNSLEALYKSIILHQNYVFNQDQNEREQEYYNILHNPTLLREYLSRLRSNALPDLETQMTIRPIIKPEYVEYIQLYGFPENGVFDTDKLGEIIEQLCEQTSENCTSLDSTTS